MRGRAGGSHLRIDEPSSLSSFVIPPIAVTGFAFLPSFNLVRMFSSSNVVDFCGTDKEMD
jgi:hypothetical protein